MNKICLECLAAEYNQLADENTHLKSAIKHVLADDCRDINIAKFYLSTVLREIDNCYQVHRTNQQDLPHSAHIVPGRPSSCGASLFVLTEENNKKGE